MRNNFSAISNLFSVLDPSNKRKINLSKFSKRGKGIYSNAPWYQTDIRIQQLDHNGQVTSESVYHNAFVSEVSSIDYQDEVGDISTTTLTLAYTGVSIDEDSVTAMSLNRN
jgi:hypothetical protein